MTLRDSKASIIAGHSYWPADQNS